MANFLDHTQQAAVLLAAGPGRIRERLAAAVAELFRDRAGLEQLPEPLRELADAISTKWSAYGQTETEACAIARDVLELAMRARAHYTGMAEHLLNGYAEGDAAYDEYDQLSGR
jgi:hypothetical protein